MSGKDEKPAPLVKREEQDLIACPHCGSTTWKQYQSYSSTTLVNLEDGSVTEEEPEWYDADDWLCSECDEYPPGHICEELRRHY